MSRSEQAILPEDAVYLASCFMHRESGFHSASPSGVNGEGSSHERSKVPIGPTGLVDFLYEMAVDEKLGGEDRIAKGYGDTFKWIQGQ